VGLARRNFENLEREKTVKIMQGFSFKIEEAKMMVAILVPEVKNANGVNTFQVFTSEKNDSQLGGVAKTKNVYWHPNGSKKKK
jgi:hypothetical protein